MTVRTPRPAPPTTAAHSAARRSVGVGEHALAAPGDGVAPSADSATEAGAAPPAEGVEATHGATAGATAPAGRGLSTAQPFATTEQVLEAAGVDRGTVLRWAREGRLPPPSIERRRGGVVTRWPPNAPELAAELAARSPKASRPRSPEGVVRRGLFTAGTNIRWDNLRTWIEGTYTLRARAAQCNGYEHHRNLAALQRHALALAGELEVFTTATRDELRRMEGLLDEYPWIERLPNGPRVALPDALARVQAALDERDALLRRIEGEPEGPRQNHEVLLVDRHVGALHVMTVSSASARHAAEVGLRSFRGLARGQDACFLVAGVPFDPPSFCAVVDGPRIREAPAFPELPVPWHQIWRPEVKRAVKQHVLRSLADHEEER